MNLLYSIGNLFFPHLCLGCGNDLTDDSELICFNCYAALPYTQFNFRKDNKTERTFYGRIPVKNATSLLYFSKNTIVQNLLHQLKYQGQMELGRLLGRMLGESLKQSAWLREIDIVIPLPLSCRKKKLRGYNQSELLAEGIAEVTGIPVHSEIVIRTIDTATQTHKGRKDRWRNVEGIFRVQQPQLLVNKHILLIDDVITTGATLEACAASVLDLEGTNISIATLAIAIH